MVSVLERARSLPPSTVNRATSCRRRRRLSCTSMCASASRYAPRNVPSGKLMLSERDARARRPSDRAGARARRRAAARGSASTRRRCEQRIGLIERERDVGLDADRLFGELVARHRLRRRRASRRGRRAGCRHRRRSTSSGIVIEHADRRRERAREAHRARDSCDGRLSHATRRRVARAARTR